MVEQDTVRSVQSIGFAVIDRDPVAVELCCRIGTAWVERRRLALRHFLHQPVKLAGRCLVKARFALHFKDTDGLQKPQRADTVGISSIFGRFETDSDMALRREIVYLGRPHFLDDADQIGCVCQIAIMQDKPLIIRMRILIDILDPTRVER